VASARSAATAKSQSGICGMVQVNPSCLARCWCRALADGPWARDPATAPRRCLLDQGPSAGPTPPADGLPQSRVRMPMNADARRAAQLAKPQRGRMDSPALSQSYRGAGREMATAAGAADAPAARHHYGDSILNRRFVRGIFCSIEARAGNQATSRGPVLRVVTQIYLRQEIEKSGREHLNQLRDLRNGQLPFLGCKVTARWSRSGSL
jgi:hypothetical protein